MSFSTIGTGTGGGGGSAQQVNFSVTASTSQTISALYIANSIVDVAGLLVAIQNTGGAAITLTAASGSIVNTASYSDMSTATTVTIQPNQTLVLETNLANLQYYIASTSTINNVAGGGAGQLLYQSANSVTSFVPTGTANYMLQSNGTAAPSWVPVAVPNVQGGNPGELLYQTATNATGFITPGTSGQFLVSNGTSMPTWMTLAAGQGVTINTVGATTTINNARGFTLGLAAVGGTSSTIANVLNTYSLVDVAGAVYTLWNNTSANYTVSFGVLVNYTSWVQNGYFMNVGDIILYPGQSATFQTFTPGSSYGVESTTQTQSVGFSAQMGSSGSLPANTDTLMNFVKVSDPWNGFNDSTHAYVIPREGFWFFQANNNFTPNSTGYDCNIQIRKNGVQQSINFCGNYRTTSNITMQTYAAIFCSLGDQITVTNWINANGIGVNTGVSTSFTGMLLK